MQQSKQETNSQYQVSDVTNVYNEEGDIVAKIVDISNELHPILSICFVEDDKGHFNIIQTIEVTKHGTNDMLMDYLKKSCFDQQ